MKNKVEIRLEILVVKALNILSNEGKIPTMNIVSMDKYNGEPKNINNKSKIKENTKIFISRFAIIESNKAIFILFKILKFLLIKSIVFFLNFLLFGKNRP